MYRVPPDRAWWPAVGAPLERGVRPQYCCVKVQVPDFLRLSRPPVRGPADLSQPWVYPRIKRKGNSIGLGLTLQLAKDVFHCLVVLAVSMSSMERRLLNMDGVHLGHL